MPGRAPSGSSSPTRIGAEASVALARLAAGEQSSERTHPFGLGAGRLVQAALRFALAVGATARAVLGEVVEVGEGLDQPVGVDVVQAEGADPRRVHDPA